ncbi:AAA family ATPase [Prosthecobacter algae]|uniref:AAA family ATPase n=1 Tax=Prosthecobacter algae TaxID=1144682 RepID=A0ABP9NVT9_9BACT
MIQRIERLRAFGIYRDFTGNDQSGVPVFKKRNLIYGWNYSGKTTLSRLFQDLQFPARPLVHVGSRFSVRFADGTEATEANRTTPHPIRVFNRDFISANFQEEHSAPAVFIVGEENLALRHRLESLRDAQTRLQLREQERQTIIDRIEREDSTAGTIRATAVSQILGVRDFRRPNLDTRIVQVRSNPAEYEMTDDRRQAAIDTFRSGDQFTEIAPLQITLPDLATEIASVRSLLRRTASFDAIQGLSENRPLEDWLRTGLGLHNAPEVCRFCGGELPQERLEALRSHFSTASQELLAQVNRKIEQLQVFTFLPPRLDALHFLQEGRDQARIELERLADWLGYASGIRDSLVASLEHKRIALETVLEWNDSEDRLEEGQQAIGVLGLCIQQHNDNILNMATVKREAREAIERHYAAVHYSEQNLADHGVEIELLEKRNRRSAAARERLGREAQQIAEQIDRTARGAGRFMELVAYLLRGSDIRVVSRGEAEFQLMRGDTPAEKMSDGEKIAIAFAYFMTSLEGDGETLANTIVYVDDPISSLDSNHVYAVYALIVERLHTAHQLFVSTHNSEFFNLLKGLWLSGRIYPADSEAFYVRRSTDVTGTSAALEPLPRLLRKFKSEYEFIFAQLHGFATAPTPSDHEAYTAPNLLRRFLEAYLGFRKPDITAWHEKIDLILDSPAERLEVHKLLDDASHLQNTGRALQHPSFISIAQPCVQSVLRGLQTKDPSHYQSLVTVVS